MRAVVLAGGFGTRLRPLTSTRPKQMLPIVNMPLIERIIEHLARHGVDDVVLSMGYRPDAIVAAYPDNRCAGVRLTYAVEPEPLGTAGGIGFAARHAGIDDRFLVVNGDVLTDLDLDALVRFHAARGAQATIHLHPVEDPSRFGVVPTDDDGRVQAFVEKPAPGEAPTNLINAGTYVLEPSVLDRIPPGQHVSIERETFPALVEAGRLYACDGSSYWIDVGTPQQYLEAQLDLLDGVSAPGPLDGVDPAATVDAEATVVRSVVGAGAVVAAGARVERSVLLPGVTVGADAVVSDSVVGQNSTVASGASVTGGTIIGDGEVVDPGTSLDGARVPVPS
jgi:mannose-1-phosphate guanylyltransferase